jgi:hypothetical protein
VATMVGSFESATCLFGARGGAETPKAPGTALPRAFVYGVASRCLFPASSRP